MPVDTPQDAFPYATYRDYVSALSATDNAYQKLGQFLDSSLDIGYGLHVHNETQVPRNGSITIIDHIGEKLESQDFGIGVDYAKESVKDCIATLIQRSESSKTRLILFSYHRDPFTGEYTGINTDILDLVCKEYRVHPEALMWHFGSDYGLDRRFFPYAKPPIPSALSNRTFCHLQNDHYVFSACLSSSDNSGRPDTVVMFARDHEFPNWSLLTSRLVFLDSRLPLPDPSQKKVSRWINDLFTVAIHQTSLDNGSANAPNPMEYIISYAQMILINATFVVDTWAMKVMHPQGKTSSNLEVHYDKQVGLMNEIRMNLHALKIFTTDRSSPRWKSMLVDYERVLANTEQQVNVVLAQKMTYRAAMASLDESRMGIEHAKKGMEQNARVKRLTQLAFIFIPLSFSTSLFGMNLEILGTGNAKAWMVFLAILLAYGAISVIWVLIEYQNLKSTWAAGTELPWWPLRLFTFKHDEQLGRSGP